MLASDVMGGSSNSRWPFRCRQFFFLSGQSDGFQYVRVVNPIHSSRDLPPRHIFVPVPPPRTTVRIRLSTTSGRL